jgi:hypothetical protein
MLTVESQFADTVPAELVGAVPRDVKVFALCTGPFGKVWLAERTVGWARVEVRLLGVDLEPVWLAMRSNTFRPLGQGAGVHGEVAGEVLYVRREPARAPWKSRSVRIELGGRAYQLERRWRRVTLSDSLGEVVAVTDAKEHLLEQRATNEWMLAVLCFAAKLDEATRSPLAAIFL